MLLECEFENVETASGPNQILSILASKPVDVVILDMNFSAGVNTGNEGLFWLRRILEARPELPVIMLTAYGDVELAVKALKSGAVDFILKPWDNDALLHKVNTAYAARKQAPQSLPPGAQPRKSEPAMLIGHSPAMMKLIKVVTKVAKTDANILITGENGTGKEMLAREIHRLSLRSAKEMVGVDVGAISESLFESELFGHEKGAFTDAHESRAGKFEVASGSTLFLDEIGNLPLSLQAKLLVVLQNRELTRVGSNKKVSVDIRLIAATNRHIPEMVALAHFRQDLFYRINTIHIEIPPLRSRREDIPLFADFFLKKYTSLYKRSGMEFHPAALEMLKANHWPGNIRELQHTIEKAVILTEKTTIRTADLLVRPSKPVPYPGEAANLGEVERQAIAAAISQNDGNLTAAAEQLGISRQTLYNKLKRFNT